MENVPCYCVADIKPVHSHCPKPCKFMLGSVAEDCPVSSYVNDCLMPLLVKGNVADTSAMNLLLGVWQFLTPRPPRMIVLYLNFAYYSTP